MTSEADELLPDPVALIEDTDWETLEHAYGPATDTAVRLVELLDEDPEVRANALGQLDMSVLHQGSLYSATPPAALFVAAILGHPRTLTGHESAYPWDDRRRPFRAALLEWLGQMAESAAYEEPGDGVEVEEDERDAIESCRAIRPAIYSAVAPYLDDPLPAVREAAVGAAVQLLQAPGLAGHRPSVARLLERSLATSDDRRERAAAVLTLGALEQDTVHLLRDRDPAVRACAALAPGCAQDAEATRVLLAALSDPATADSWFREPLPQFNGWFRFTLLEALIQRVATFEEALPAALAIARITSAFTVDREWGPLLVKAFPDGYVPGTELTGAQRSFLQALAENDNCWGLIANPRSWFKRTGLPEERAEIQALLE